MTRALAALLLAGIALTLSGCGLLDDEGPAGDDVFSIVVGDCLDDAGVGDEVTTLPIVPCDEPHDSEVFARTAAEEDDFPGDAELEAMLVEFCRGAATASCSAPSSTKAARSSPDRSPASRNDLADPPTPRRIVPLRRLTGLARLVP